MTDKPKTCFVIMPISTPENYLNFYNNDSSHFEHVLEYLLKPSIEKAGYTVVPPIAEGSDIIHANIIQNLEKTDLVLCDMSTLNANVFFEFGIRTALNKPICLVKDDLTKKVPFDMHIINNHTYNSNLSLWIVDKEIDKLSKHIQNTSKEKQNSLWDYFSLSTRGELGKSINTESDQIKLLRMQIEALRQDFKEKDTIPLFPIRVDKITIDDIVQEIMVKLSLRKYKVSSYTYDNKKIEIRLAPSITIIDRLVINSIARTAGIDVVFIEENSKGNPIRVE